MLPEHRCYWKVVSPDTKVAIVFGPFAARKYGTDMTLWQGMSGRGDPYRTLLREGTTSLLNSYNSIAFPYHSFAVIQHMNWALMGSTRQVLRTALRFMRANSGTSFNVTCRFNVCSWSKHLQSNLDHRMFPGFLVFTYVIYEIFFLFKLYDCLRSIEIILNNFILTRMIGSVLLKFL